MRAQARPCVIRHYEQMTQNGSRTRRFFGVVEVVGEALDDRGQLSAVGLHEVVTEQRGQRRRGSLVVGPGPDRDLPPQAVRCLTMEIAQPVDKQRWRRRTRCSARSTTCCQRASLTASREPTTTIVYDRRHDDRVRRRAIFLLELKATASSSNRLPERAHELPGVSEQSRTSPNCRRLHLTLRGKTATERLCQLRIACDPVQQLA
jgi:hypothetical protein